VVAVLSYRYTFIPMAFTCYCEDLPCPSYIFLSVACSLVLFIACGHSRCSSRTSCRHHALSAALEVDGVLAIAARTRRKSTGGRLPKTEAHDTRHATTTALGHHNDYPIPHHVRHTLTVLPHPIDQRPLSCRVLQLCFLRQPCYNTCICLHLVQICLPTSHAACRCAWAQCHSRIRLHRRSY
jgi:hypothetical protein